MLLADRVFFFFFCVCVSCYFANSCSPPGFLQPGLPDGSRLRPTDWWKLSNRSDSLLSSCNSHITVVHANSQFALHWLPPDGTWSCRRQCCLKVTPHGGSGYRHSWFPPAPTPCPLDLCQVPHTSGSSSLRSPPDSSIVNLSPSPDQFYGFTVCLSGGWGGFGVWRWKTAGYSASPPRRLSLRPLLRW
jgi:hypothetical protein